MDFDIDDLLASLNDIQLALTGRCDSEVKVYKNGFVMLTVSSEGGVETWIIDPEWDEYRKDSTLVRIREKLGIQKPRITT